MSPIIKGFTTKDPNWQDKILTAIDKDPNSKVKLGFSATNFKSDKNPFEKTSKVFSKGKLFNWKKRLSKIV